MGLKYFLTAAVAIVACFLSLGAEQAATIEFKIRQNLDLILFSDFGEPPQVAIWLENPETHAFRTVYVTRRSGKGEWEGKLECPASLPRWFEVFRKEFGKTCLPNSKQPVPDGISGATCTEETFSARIDVPVGSKWICWIEVNISADFNDAFPRPGEVSGPADTDLSGQPSILYRAEINALPGADATPELWGYTRPGTVSGETEQDLQKITTAKDILTEIAITALPTNPGK